MLADRLRWITNIIATVARTFISGYPLTGGVTPAIHESTISWGADYQTYGTVYLYWQTTTTDGEYFYIENMTNGTVRIYTNRVYAFYYDLPAYSRIMAVSGFKGGYGHYWVSYIPCPL
jgi:hypothetical protein